MNSKTITVNGGFLILLLFICTIFSGCLDMTPTSWSAMQEAKIQTIIDSVDRTTFDQVFAAMDGERTVDVPTAELLAFEQWYMDRFLPFGYDVYQEPVNGPSSWSTATTMKSMNNIYVVKPGANPELAPVYITAHWDTVPGTVGANDNSSACAAVLEALELVDGYTFERDIHFILFAREEEGLDGSYVRAGSADPAPAAVLNMDMIGFTSEREVAGELLHSMAGIPETGDFIGIFADPGSLQLAKTYTNTAAHFVPELKYHVIVADENLNNEIYLLDIFRSDHSGFWEKGIPALFISDTAEMRDGSPYHTPEDTKEKIDFDFMLNVTKATIATLCVLAGIQ